MNLDLFSGFSGAFNGRKVWVSGHTGFKGSWLCEWLIGLGAKVYGFAQPPSTAPSLFHQLRLESRIAGHELGDIGDPKAALQSIQRARPDFIFHLAAQPLVRLSYAQPRQTWETNVNGTLNVLEALREVTHSTAAVVVTSDKCYENHETGKAYEESDSLGGFDPYSASKGAVEVLTSAWRRSYFLKGPVRLASARAGNVIGGGDWALDRIVPDCARSLTEKQPILVRNRRAVRPWQHVLEPLSGYLWLAANLSTGQWSPPHEKSASASAFNFGPGNESNRTVEELVIEALKHWDGTWKDESDPKAVHEAHLLGLATEKAREQLHWEPSWTFQEAVKHTIDWYRMQWEGVDVLRLTQSQIQAYGTIARQKQIRWAL
jgi:CDP-glucose 4,6-dehydratase